VGPQVGFGASDRGQGAGDGVDEIVPFSFKFNRFQKVNFARLTLELTPKDALVTTDALNFADVGLDFAYGRATFQKLGSSIGQRVTVAFDLGNVDEIETVNERSTGFRDLREFLRDGTLDVVYADDAIIHRAFLVIEGVPASDEVNKEGDIVTKTYIYQGKAYYVSAQVTNGEFVVLPGPDNKFIEDLSNGPTTAFAADPNNGNTIYLANNGDELASQLESSATVPSASADVQSISPPGCVLLDPIKGCIQFYIPAALYEDSNFRGRKYVAGGPITNPRTIINLPADFNDKASSVTGGSLGVVLYEHSNGGGKSLIVSPNASTGNLSGFKMGWFYNWNDKVSSYAP
jgi:hypothetical protein